MFIIPYILILGPFLQTYITRDKLELEHVFHKSSIDSFWPVLRGRN